MNARGLEEARHVFLRGCGLPDAWAGQPQWRILETGFGLGLNFLAAWRAWKDDPQRPRMLHFVSIEPAPPSAEELRAAADPFSELHELADALAAQWWDIQAGFQRLAFEGGHVLLTLCVGDARPMLREQDFVSDSVFLNGADPRGHPSMWDAQMLKVLARCCRRGTRIASRNASSDVIRDLAQYGFAVEKADAPFLGQHCLKGTFDPAWEPRGQRASPKVTPGPCIVIGGGLAGAAAAASLARRGWIMTVLDAAAQPASGASGLPAGLLTAHASLDNNQLSQLSRSGVRLTLEQAKALLDEGDWQASGTLEKRVEGDRWHERAAWIKPAALVRAWLAQSGVEWRGNTRVVRAEHADGQWLVWDDAGQQVARAPLLVVAAACGSASLLGDALALTPVRGQVSFGFRELGTDLPPHPLNGNGHFLPAVPLQGRTAWLTGSTYDRGETSLDARDEDHRANFERLLSLAPEVARRLAPQFEAGTVRAWTGVRCASADRRPLLGEVRPGLWVSTAMGSRGLTFAVLCAELLAARLHGEPLPLQRRLAAALDVARQEAASRR